MTVTVTAEATVEPTEDEKKVERALLKLFPLARVDKKIERGVTIGLIVHGAGLEFLSCLRNLIRQDRIRSTARVLFLRSARERILKVYLNKQAAFMGRVSFCAPTGESPHGPISVLVESEDMQPVIDYLAAIPAMSSGRDLRRQRRRSPYPEEV
jgi:predicted RNA binding protein with dsRBD fold (UPF0201 family)